MSRIESAETIEGIVGAPRHETIHVARALSAEQRVYVLHSRECIEQITERGSDLRLCPFSVALDEDIDLGPWEDFQDVAVEVEIDDEYGDLVPTRTVSHPGDPS
ncbi:hypothetical protein [Microbacterium lacticum]|uniref:hypothetical protein n=1 Tax=Microbacterium lacticum TaxID=33885 RepID=UPI0028D0AF4C|nr:hypothetical protein [Microbacterium lacticum]